MENIRIVADNMISSLGFTSREHFDKLVKGEPGLSLHENFRNLKGTFCLSAIDDERLEEQKANYEIPGHFTRFESILTLSILKTVSKTDLNIKSQHTGLIISSTKGNIDLIDSRHKEAIHLSYSAGVIQEYLGLSHPPLVICNACISGLMAIITAARLIRQGKFQHVIVTGADILSTFTLSGFEALKALSPEPCRPFDADRKGINLGEAAATVILSREGSGVKVAGGSISNDANHISGPSRTGEGLQQAISAALKISGNPLPDYISAHGTATLYNDEMESAAFHALGFGEIPLNSFKGYWGHTLGAAGIMETIAACYSIEYDTLIPSAGYNKNGVTIALNVIEQTEKRRIDTCLKTSSGFGGCNCVVILQKS